MCNTAALGLRHGRRTGGACEVCPLCAPSASRRVVVSQSPPCYTPSMHTILGTLLVVVIVFFRESMVSAH